MRLDPRWRRRADDVGYTLLATALVVGLALTLLHAGQDVYYIPGYGVGIALAAFVLASVGAGLGWRSGRPGIVALTLLAVALGVIGFLSILSIGILLLAVSLALFVVAARLPRGRHHAAATGAGVLLGLGVPVLALISLSPPLVDCEASSSGENIFLGLESNSASGSVSADGRTDRGRAEGGTYRYSYTCRNGKLVQFDFRHR